MTHDIVWNVFDIIVLAYDKFPARHVTSLIYCFFDLDTPKCFDAWKENLKIRNEADTFLSVSNYFFAALTLMAGNVESQNSEACSV